MAVRYDELFRSIPVVVRRARLDQRAAAERETTGQPT